MWADAWEAARQETDVFSGKSEHSCHAHTNTRMHARAFCSSQNNYLTIFTLCAQQMFLVHFLMGDKIKYNYSS